MRITAKILESDSYIRNQILTSIKEHMEQVFKKAVPALSKSIPQVVYKVIVDEPEYQSLLSGKLKYEFGIPSSAQKVNDIIDIWTKNIVINATPITMSSSGLKGGFNINMIKDNYEDVLTSDSALVTDSMSQAVLPWLEWLLLYGDKIIVRNYEVVVGPSPYSRTGLAIMKPSKQNWRVPPEFAGTKNSNWITRALEKLDSSIPDLIQKEIENQI